MFLQIILSSNYLRLVIFLNLIFNFGNKKYGLLKVGHKFTGYVLMRII